MVGFAMRPEPGTRVRFQAGRAPAPLLSLKERLIAACDTASFGRELAAMRARLANPSASDEEVAAAVRSWLALDPPSDGRVISWPRTKR